MEDLKLIMLMIIFRRQRQCIQTGAHSTAMLINWVIPFLFFREMFDSCNVTSVFVFLLCSSPLSGCWLKISVQWSTTPT